MSRYLPGQQTAGTEKYEALKNIDTVLMAAREAAGNATLLSMGDSCGERTALGLRWGVCGSSPGNRGNMRSMCGEQPRELAIAPWTAEADNSHTCKLEVQESQCPSHRA